MVQGGYVSPSSAKTLTVNKRTNVLNKIPPRGPKNSTNNSNSTNNNNNNNNSSELSAGIDVSIPVKPTNLIPIPIPIHFQVSLD